MIKTFSILIHITLSIILIYLIFILHKTYLIQNLDFYKYLFIGIISYTISTKIINPNKYKFWNTFFHELSHIIFALLTFAKPHKLLISPDHPENGANGYVAYSYKSSKFMDSIRGHFVSLAPYFFSPIAFLFFSIYFIIAPIDGFMMRGITTSQITINIILFCSGFFYTYNLRTSFIQAKPYQSDFDNVGYKYGIVFVIFMQLFFLLFFSLILFSNYNSFLFLYEYIIDIFNDLRYDDIVFNLRIFLYEKFDIWIDI